MFASIYFGDLQIVANFAKYIQAPCKHYEFTVHILQAYAPGTKLLKTFQTLKHEH